MRRTLICGLAVATIMTVSSWSKMIERVNAGGGTRSGGAIQHSASVPSNHAY